MAHRDDRVTNFVAHSVTVNGEAARERVVLLVLLKLLERRGDDVGVEQTDLCRRVGIGAQRVPVRFRLRRVLQHLDLVDPIRETSRIDIALDVRRLVLLRVRIHLEVLNDCRIDAANDKCRQCHEADAGGGDTPIAPPDDEEEQQTNDNSDSREDRPCREDRVDVGVGRSREAVTVVQHEPKTVKDVVGRNAEHDEEPKHRKLDTRPT